METNSMVNTAVRLFAAFFAASAVFGTTFDSSPLLTTAMCPSQCVCTSTDVLCPGANVTEVFNHGINFQTLHLDLSNTMLTDIPVEVSYMTICKKLNLSSNQIESINKYTFQNLLSLEELVLNENLIEDIADINPNVLFYNNINLRVLNLSGNPFEDLGRDLNTMLFSESLEVLDVSRCQITSLEGPLVLSGLKKLVYLDLSNNPLVHMDGLYSGTLKVLSVRSCLLSQLDDNALVGFQGLEIFDASLNDQLSLDNALFSSKLRSLDLSLCSIRLLNLTSMTKLQSAFINGNRIKQIHAFQFINNSELITLDLSGNHVETVDPMAFDGLTSLVYLDLSFNKIMDVPWEMIMATMPTLEILNLSNNRISALGPMRSDTLRQLDLSHCWIQIVTNDTFSQLTGLVELVLSNNPLHTLLPGSLNITQLVRLDLSYCRISHVVSRHFAYATELTELRLTGNRLVTLKNGTFSRCPKLRDVYLDDNPWRCDCYSIDFAYMARLVNATVGRQNAGAERSPRCQSPENVTSVPWHVACANGSVYGRDNRKNFSMAVGVILILCVSGMMAICVAVHENVKTRQAMRRRRQLDGEYGGGGGGGGGGPGVGGGTNGRSGEYFDEYAAAAESMRKLSQLPSYDEAIMLPKPVDPSPRSSHRRAAPIKRHSCTQTEIRLPPPPPPPPSLFELIAVDGRDGRSGRRKTSAAPSGVRVTHL